MNNTEGADSAGDTQAADITDLLNHVADGTDPDSGSSDALYDRVYGDLRSLARMQLRRLRPGQTLNTTGLVHEAFLRLVNQDGFKNRGHFFAVSAQAMRQILIDRARRRSAQKRGDGLRPISLDLVNPSAEEQSEIVLWLDSALNRLRAENPRWAQVAECRFFGGYSVSETAEALGVSDATVQRDSVKARAWLQRELSEPTEAAVSHPG